MNYLISVWSYIFEERTLDRILVKRQKIHLHSFAGDADLVSEWSESFGISGLVRTSDSRQIKALLSIPLDRLLVEKDSPPFHQFSGMYRRHSSPCCHIEG